MKRTFLVVLSSILAGVIAHVGWYHLRRPPTDLETQLAWVAIDLGLNLPLVYNTSAYDSLESLALLDGLVDIYMPDFKCFSDGPSNRYLRAQDYPDAARAAIREMHRQVGDLVLDSRGIARRGLLLRHLIMPGQFQETRTILEWAATELGPNTYVNLMDQYRPAWKVAGDQYKEIGRPVATEEFAKAERFAWDLGLRLHHRNPASGVRIPPRH